MVRFAVISWNISTKIPKDEYIILGELYEQIDLISLHKLYQDLKYLYPFKCIVYKNNIECFNNEDFNHLRDKHNLSYNITYSKIVNEKVIMSFRTPSLYNLTDMKPYGHYIYDSIIPSVKPKEEWTVIVVPYVDPFIRGNLIDKCLKYQTLDRRLKFLLLGDNIGENKDKINTLYKRYLLRKGFPEEDICKLSYTLDETIKLYQDFAGITNIFVAVHWKDIHDFRDGLKMLRYKGVINKKVRYITDAY